MQYLAICQRCKFAFALPASIDKAICPKPDCGGSAIVSDGTYSSFWRAFHESFPTVTSRKQKREIQKLAQAMLAGEITPEQALEDSSLSPETIQFLSLLVAAGVGVVGILMSILTLLQMQAHHEENRRDREQDREDQRVFLEAIAENFEHLHQNDEILLSRLRRVEDAQLVEIEEEPHPTQVRSQTRRRAENAASPKPRSQEPKPKRKSKKTS